MFLSSIGGLVGFSFSLILTCAGQVDIQSANLPKKVYVNSQGDIITPEYFAWGHYAMREEDAAQPGTPGEPFDIGRRGRGWGRRQLVCPATSCNQFCCNAGESCCGSSCCRAGQFCQGPAICCNAGEIGCGQACCSAGYTCCANRCCHAGFDCVDGMCFAPASYNNTASASGTTLDASVAATTSSTPPPESSTGISTGAIVGIAIAGLLLLLILIGACLLYRRRKKRSQSAPPEMRGHAINPEPRPLSIPRTDVPIFSHPEPVDRFSMSGRSPVLDRTSYNPSSNWDHSEDLSPSNTADTAVEGVPPRYGTFAALGAWAQANREVITEELEEKLLVAGYVSTDDPDGFTEEEWQTKYGVTRLELRRLQKLYARDHGNL